MPKPILSICIPTRERRRYLEATLASLLSPNAFPFAIEIIVSDNAGEDDTGDLVRGLIAGGAPLRYFRQPHDRGVVNNMYSAFRRARGEFTVYLADDDRLLPENVGRTVSWLQANPQAVAVYAPWETYDAVDDKAHTVSFVLDQGAEFGPDDRLDVLDLLLRHDIMPEVPLLRSAAVGSMMFGSAHVYWCFLAIDRLLDSGTIRFSNLPYYRSVTRHWEGETRSTVTKRNSVAQWDTVRRGFEYLFWRARVGRTLSPDQEADFARRIAAQDRHYLGYAFHSRIEAGDFKTAADIALLMAAVGIPALGDEQRLVAMCAAADQILEVLDLLDELEGVAVYGFPNPESIAGLLRVRRPDVRVASIDDPADARFKSAFLVVAGNGLQRDRLLEVGYQPGFVIDFARLFGFITAPAAVIDKR